MSFTTRALPQALVLASLLLAGCAADGSSSFFTTGALGTQQTAAVEPKVDPVCVSLVSRIETLRKEGVAEKIEKASMQKYKMTKSDLAKADQLNKASSEFQMRCSTISPAEMAAAQAAAPGPAPKPPVAKKAAAAPKTSAAAAPAQN